MSAGNDTQPPQLCSCHSLTSAGAVGLTELGKVVVRGLEPDVSGRHRSLVRVRRGRRLTGEVQSNRGLANWLGDLVEFGVDPELYILEVTSEQQAVAQEKRWTDYFKKKGFPLLNRRRIVNNSWVVKRRRDVPKTMARLLDCLAEKHEKP